MIFFGSVIYRKRFIWKTIEKPDGIREDRLGGGKRGRVREGGCGGDEREGEVFGEVGG